LTVSSSGLALNANGGLLVGIVRAGQRVRADVEVLVPLQDCRQRLRHGLGVHYLAIDLQRAGTLTVVLERPVLRTRRPGFAGGVRCAALRAAARRPLACHAGGRRRCGAAGGGSTYRRASRCRAAAQRRRTRTPHTHRQPGCRQAAGGEVARPFATSPRRRRLALRPGGEGPGYNQPTVDELRRPRRIRQSSARVRVDSLPILNCMALARRPAQGPSAG
jgi:hypothetical protein